MLSSDMQSCTKKANVMYTGQDNKEQVSQDLKDGFLIYMLTTRRPGMFVWFWTKGTLESIVVRFWVQKRRPGIVVWIWTKGTLESIVEILRNLLFIALACVHNVCLFGTRLHITG